MSAGKKRHLQPSDVGRITAFFAPAQHDSRRVAASELSIASFPAAGPVPSCRPEPQTATAAKRPRHDDVGGGSGGVAVVASASGALEHGGAEATEVAWAAHGRSHLSATDVAVLARATYRRPGRWRASAKQSTKGSAKGSGVAAPKG